MPIYEYYCPDNNRIYQFFAKTLAQGQTTPKCPDNPAFRMERMMSTFAISGKAAEPKEAASGGEDGGTGGEEGGAADDPRLEAAFSEMEREMDGVDENDPRAMGRMMRKMSELTGEKLDEQMEEVVRKLEEGTDPDTLEEQMGDAFPEGGEGGDDAMGGMGGGGGGLRGAPTRDPHLYDY
ncbi:MAG TPA: FmdB family transcriptional regulator [Opitutaceae bacterium]|nr:FmdB family transcriptional regulator [Opitutaceae bacterium]